MKRDTPPRPSRTLVLSWLSVLAIALAFVGGSCVEEEEEPKLHLGKGTIIAPSGGAVGSSSSAPPSSSEGSGEQGATPPRTSPGGEPSSGPDSPGGW